MHSSKTGLFSAGAGRVPNNSFRLRDAAHQACCKISHHGYVRTYAKEPRLCSCKAGGICPGPSESVAQSSRHLPRLDGQNTSWQAGSMTRLLRSGGRHGQKRQKAPDARERGPNCPRRRCSSNSLSNPLPRPARKSDRCAPEAASLIKTAQIRALMGTPTDETARVDGKPDELGVPSEPFHCECQ
jgi:hypothetical protein